MTPIDELVLIINDLLQCSPSYRDYSGTDCQTCVFCKEVIEPGYEEHRADCPWLRLVYFDPKRLRK